jgi:hypothetical protein
MRLGFTEQEMHRELFVNLGNRERLQDIILKFILGKCVVTWMELLQIDPL